MWRFVEAQDRVYPTVLRELRAGQKKSHWIWYVFPQIKGLGSSPMAQKYAIASREEAVAYSEHPILGSRLRECTQIVLDVEDRSAEEIFGYPDYLKFRSCMTLFEQCAKEDAIFRDALLKYFDGDRDLYTIQVLNEGNC